jgi:integrase
VKHKLTPAFCMNPPPPPEGRDRIVYWEGGLGLQVTRAGHRSWVIQYRVGRQSHRMALKAGLDLRDARKEAKGILGAVAKGGDPLADKRKSAATASNTLKAIGETYFREKGEKLRTAKERQRTVERLIFPKFGNRQISDIKRSEIVRLLDKIEEEHGAHMSQAALAFLSALFTWHASRDDDFRSPIVRGMSRTTVKETARDRTLSDDELRAVWQATEAIGGNFGRLVQFLLLTATRRSEAARMTWAELATGDWVIPAARMKNKLEHVVPPSPAAKAILDQMPKVGPYVFTLDGRKPHSAITAGKAHLDEASGVTGWRLHDLRRTARSLMSRARVDPDIAERCLAHVIGGIRGIYDRHAFYEEKKQAFEALAAQVDRVVNPVDNVRPLLKRGAAR